MKLTLAELKKRKLAERSQICTNTKYGRPVQAAEARIRYAIISAALRRAEADEALTACGIPLDNWEAAVAPLVRR